MKFSKTVALLSLTLIGSIGMTGCKSNAKMPVNFVAVTSSEYNAEVQFGDYDYKFQGKINQGSNTFTLAANAIARHATASQGGGMGGFPGGGFPGGGPGGNSSGPAFEGFGAGEQQQGGEQGQGQQGGEQQGNPFGGNEQGQGQQGGQQQGNDNPFGGGDNPWGGQQGGGQQGGGQEQQPAVAPTSLRPAPYTGIS